MRASLLLGLAVCAPVAPAGDWRIATGIGGSVFYSDNIDQDPKGQESDGFITEISPFISIHGQGGGKRLKLDFDYAPQGIGFSSGRDSNELRHRMQGLATAEILSDRLFLDARASATQAITDATGRVPTDNLSGGGNLSDVFTYSLSPYYLWHIGDFADARVQYTFDEVRYSDNATRDSTSQSWRGALVSGRRFAIFRWGLNYRQQDVEYDEGRTDTFRQVNGTAGYQINRKLGIDGSLGYEDNDFQSRSGGNPSGRSWTLGGNWTPTPRTQLRAGFGNRFFGDTYYLDLSHRSRRTVWTLAYNEDITSTRGIQLGQVLVPLVDEFGDPIQDPLTGEVFVIPLDAATPTDETILRQRLEGGVALQGKRQTIRFRLYAEDRAYQDTGRDESVLGGQVSLNRSLSSATSASLTGRWQTSEFPAPTGDRDLWGLDLSLTRSFASDLSGSLTYRYVQQDSDNPLNSYEENRIGVRISKRF